MRRYRHRQAIMAIDLQLLYSLLGDDLWPPTARRRSTAASRRAFGRHAITSVAPELSSASAQARPMPLEQPVTT